MKILIISIAVAFLAYGSSIGEAELINMYADMNSFHYKFYDKVGFVLIYFSVIPIVLFVLNILPLHITYLHIISKAVSIFYIILSVVFRISSYIEYIFSKNR